MIIDPAWEGTVQFYELIFGTWLAYGFLTLMWERGLKCRLPEWKYVLITFLGAGAYWINHYFQHAPWYGWMLTLYAIVFLTTYYRVTGHGQECSLLWRIGAMASAIVFSVAFILFENISRFTVNGFGISEFWFMLIAFFGFLFIILWRGRKAPS